MQEGTSIATCVASRQLVEMVKRDVAGRADDPDVAGVPSGGGGQIAGKEGKWPR